jgi:succinate dehydrogenase/fumarate reductase iron-sulfur protein
MTDAAADGTVTLTVGRSHGGRESFTLAAGANTSVLDLLFAAQREHDRTLVFRFSCRIGVCGSCAVRVNGREALACRTRARDAGPTIRLEPLRHLPVVRDLAVDLAPFRSGLERALPAFRPVPAVRDAAAPRPAAVPEIAGGTGDCITCAACWSACARVAREPGYPGAAALIRAAALLTDPRDAAHEQRLAALTPSLSGEDDACTAVCPKGLRHEPVRAWLREQLKNEGTADGA